MIYITIFYIITFSICLILGRNKYSGLCKQINNKDWLLKELIPAGFLFLEIWDWVKLRSGFIEKRLCSRKVAAYIVELYGLGNYLANIKLFKVNRIVIVYLGTLFCLFIGCLAKIDSGLLIFIISIISGTIYFPIWQLKDKVKLKRRSISIDFPDFLNKMILLLNAGMTVSKAWERATEQTRDTILYRELACVMTDIRLGRSEAVAFEEFAKRCRMPEITRLMSVLVQNIRKGNGQLVYILGIHAGECWEMRKNTASKLGEEASTKLLLPLMLMFAAIIILVMTPAVLALRAV